MNVVCAWLRNDLRVHDNAVLHEAKDRIRLRGVSAAKMDHGGLMVVQW